MKKEEKRFPKAPLFQIRFCGLPPKLNYGGIQKRNWNPFYTRMANAARIYIYPLSISWRMSWHPNAAYSMGWDAHFRQTHNLGEYAVEVSNVK